MIDFDRFTYTLVDTPDLLRRLGEKLGNARRMGLDTESAGPVLVKPQLTAAGNVSYKNFINMYRSETTGWSVALDDGTAYYVPMNHRKGNAPFRPSLDLLSRLLQDPCHKYIHNLKHELLAFDRLGLPQEFNPSLRCTQVMAWLTNQGQGSKFGLKELSRTILGHEMSTFEETVGQERGFDVLKPKDGTAYACEDAVAALLLADRYLPVLKSWDLENWAWNVEMPFVWCLRSMTDTGIVLDRDAVQHAYDTAQARSKPAQAAFEGLTDGVSPGSTKQMQSLWERGWWPADSLKTAKGAYSTTAEVIEGFAENLPQGSNGQKAASILVEYRSLQKVISTYSHSLVRLADQYPDGRLHPDYLQTGTATGRISSSYPNGTNMPAHGEAAALVASCLRGHGQSLGSADQSQIDLRLLAHVSGGELRDVYMRAGDVHQETADACGCSRKQGKPINFAKIYGAWYKKLAQQIGVKEKDAKLFVERYDARYPDVVKVIETIKRAAHARGYVRTLSGRRRYLPGLKSSKTQWSGERKAVNTVCQGGAADVVKKSMVDYYLAGHTKTFPLQTQIHDDLRWVSPYEKNDPRSIEAADTVVQIMQDCWKLRVPLVSEAQRGETWKDLK